MALVMIIIPGSDYINIQNTQIYEAPYAELQKH